MIRKRKRKRKRFLSSVCVFGFIFAIFVVAQQESNCVKSIDSQAVKPYFGRNEKNIEQNGTYQSESESIIWAKETDLTFLPYQTDSNINAITIP